MRLDISRQSMLFKKGRREGVGDGVNRETSLPGQTLYARESCWTPSEFSSHLLTSFFARWTDHHGKMFLHFVNFRKVSSLWVWGSSVLLQKGQISIFVYVSIYLSPVLVFLPQLNFLVLSIIDKAFNTLHTLENKLIGVLFFLFVYFLSLHFFSVFLMALSSEPNTLP